MRLDRWASITDGSSVSIHAPTRDWSERTGSIAPARRGLRALGIAAGLALASPCARVHAAEPPASEPAGAAAEVLRVEVAPGIGDAALLPGWIAERHSGLPKALRGPPGGPEQWIDVEITGSTYDYRVSVAAVRDGQSLGPRGEPTRCECTIEELLALVDVGIAAASEQLREPASSEPPPKVAPPEAPPPATSPPSEQPGMTGRPTPVTDARRPLGVLGRAGIGTSAAGAGLATAGIVLALRPKEIRGAPGRTEIRDFRATGIGLAATGGALLAAGVAMLVVERVAPRGRRAALAPALGPSSAGISLAGRF